MPARVTGESVKEIVTTDLDVDLVTAHMVDTAHQFVEANLSSSGLSEGLLEKIELFLAAHYVVLVSERGGITRAKMGDADESYANVYGSGLASTRFGQAAINLDSTGTLAGMSSTAPKAEFRVV